MTDCCTPTSAEKHPPKRYVCPVNGKSYSRVAYKTVLHHISKPWQSTPKDQAYYFCDDPNCDVVYFGTDDSTILKHQMRTQVGIKNPSNTGLVCYCFGITKAQSSQDKSAKAFVIEQTKNSLCSCSTCNPSGKCCLKDFPG